MLGTLHQDYPGPLWIDLVELVTQRVNRDLDQGTGQLHTGRTCTHHDECEPPACLLGLPFGRLEGLQNSSPNRERVLDGLQPGGHFFPVVVPEVRVGSPRSDNEVVILHRRPVIESHRTTPRIDPYHLGQEDGLHVVLVAKHRANRIGDVARVEGGSRHLIQEGLE